MADKTNETAAKPETTQPTNPGQSASQSNVGVSTTEFTAGNDSGAIHPDQSIHRFREIRVPVMAELGRTTMPIGELLKLGEGSVIELGRSVSSYVDVMSQGVRIARGEVVVVDDCFAVRIKEIDTPPDEAG